MFLWIHYLKVMKFIKLFYNTLSLSFPLCQRKVANSSMQMDEAVLGKKSDIYLSSN